jgi:hypothetical protein
MAVVLTVVVVLVGLIFLRLRRVGEKAGARS